MSKTIKTEPRFIVQQVKFPSLADFLNRYPAYCLVDTAWVEGELNDYATVILELRVENPHCQLLDYMENLLITIRESNQ